MHPDLIQLTPTQSVMKCWVRSVVYLNGNCTFVLDISVFGDPRGTATVVYSGDEAKLAWDNWNDQGGEMIARIPDDVLEKLKNRLTTNLNMISL